MAALLARALAPHPTGTPPALPETRVQAAAIRALDVAVAGALLTLLAPVYAAIAIAVRVDSAGPVLFRQQRCGRERRLITIRKFRTMHCGTTADRHREYVVGLIRGEPADAPVSRQGLYKLQDDPRVTRVGGVLRRFSLDELPQLWNVLRGDMSLVGPRPPIPYEVDCYPPAWLQRLAVKPGLTGLWQVSGRNELTYAQMVAVDLVYVERRSLWLNLRILARTGWVVLRGRGAS
ncbi:MAG: Undecaprenyl-phosphate galactose phosphotransferase [Solirubrobacterales bacterium]|nr:Undecaprenyl-phosphate galactose phosphotransferase [Solirubrobacterales bacterium]